MPTMKQLLKRKSWHRRVPRARRSPEEAADFLDRIIRMAATRASMASWGQPFEAIASWLLLAKNREDRRKKGE